jgi:hypothetical protein
MNKINQLYVNGCSFSNDPQIFHYSNGKQYSDYFEENYQINVINRGTPGSCNRRIIRTTLRDSLEFDSNTFVIIQLTDLHRTEITASNDWWQNDDVFDPSQQEICQSIKPIDSKNGLYKKYIEERTKLINDKQLFDELMVDLLLLTKFLKSKNIDYYVYNHAWLFNKNFVPHSSSFYQKINTDSQVNDFFKPLSDMLTNEDDYYNDGGNPVPGGHLSQKGHYRMFETLIKLINIFD